uniref:RNA-directed DNA polymerase, eukaryota, reverse transcriptase zinc-binding domain protein n=1 Tax=Tanacetum cinerariifolium TaxID=118510 RepID=A0A699HQ46_TANCI|nr:hypothetical protein [Tanacetum cinerariifolium]
MGCMETWMGFYIGEFPITYFGLPIGENMGQLKSWKPVVEKFKNRLAGWKAKNNVVLGASYIGEIDSRKLAIGNGGGDLRRRVGGYGLGLLKAYTAYVGDWGHYGRVYVVMRGEVGEGRDIRFRVDRWVDNRRLYDRFPRLFHLDSRKEGSVMDKLKWVNNGWVGAWDWSRNISGRVCREYDDLIEALGNVAVSNSCKDRWRWTLGEDGDFKVKILASLIEEKILQVKNGGHDTRWNNLCKLLAVASIIFWQWHQSSLAVGTYTASGNSNLAVGMPCVFYSQQSSPKLDAPFAFKFSRIK